ncbi:MAG TPA: SDR family oxidoreductase [Candidatus Binataceae bacterium]|nr:SDR family oxidoreductase [Candidatus Binataceae bacterium]
MKLKDKVAIVTGAAQGIGREYSLRFVEEGAAVALVDTRFEQAKAVEQEIIKKNGQALAIAADVANESEVAAMAKQVAERFGRIDALVNNAAIYYDLEMGRASLEYGRKVMDVNVFGVMLASWAVFPYMQQQRSGSIINIASIAAWPGAITPPSIRSTRAGGITGGDLYGISKAAVVFITQSMALNFGKSNVRVNAIAPGVTMSEATRKVVSGRFIETLVGQSALGRSLKPRDLAGTAVFLASDDSALMTGQCLVVDAGCKIS